MRPTFILGRIAVRCGEAIWRHKLAWLLAGMAVAGLSLYELSYARPSAPSQAATVVGLSMTRADCADTTMAAAMAVDDDLARAAYACLSPKLKTSTEDRYVAVMRQPDVPGGVPIRVSEQHTIDGGRIVFFTVDTVVQPGETIGYMIYLDAQGKVVKVE